MYLLGRKFNAVTNCNALNATDGENEHLSRTVWWWLHLQQFEFVVEHRTRELMKDVNALSTNLCVSGKVPEETVF